MTKHELIARIEACARKFGVSPSTIGERAGQGGQFYARLKSGKKAWPETIEAVGARVDEFMQSGLPSVCNSSHANGRRNVQAGDDKKAGSAQSEASQ